MGSIAPAVSQLPQEFLETLPRPPTMGSVAPAIVATGVEGPMPPFPRRVVPTSHDIQMEQLLYILHQLDVEVSEHNKTRAKLLYFTGKAMANERALCSEQENARYLNYLIQDLKAQVQSEIAGRVKAEEEKKEMSIKNLGNCYTFGLDHTDLDDYFEPSEEALDDQDLDELEQIRRDGNMESTKRKFCHISDITNEEDEEPNKRVKN